MFGKDKAREYIMSGLVMEQSLTLLECFSRIRLAHILCQVWLWCNVTVFRVFGKDKASEYIMAGMSMEQYNCFDSVWQR